MTACPDDAALARLAEGASDPAERAATLAHVDECAACLRALAGAAADADDRPPPPTIGDQLGRFEILALLGAGAMGLVYQARDRELDRVVALKLLRPDRDVDGAAAVDRLRAEARALAQVSSPHVVTVHDTGTADGHTFIAMERVAGVDLRQWLAARPRSRRAIVEAFVQAGRGLAAAHQAGVIHRDFKPDNVLVGDDGRIRVGDFGLARRPVLADADLAATGGGAAGSDAIMTRTLAGTPAYMAPEQHGGGAVSARSDQFAFCIALAEALTDVRPAPDPAGVWRLVDRPRLPARLRGAIERGLAVDPARRWPDMTALVDALRPWTGPGRARALVVIGAAAAAAAVTGAVLAARWTRPAAAPACDDGAAAIAGVWSPPRRAVAERALGAGPFADVDRALGRFAGRWAAAHDAACRLGTATAAAAADCLGLARAEVDGLVDVIARVEATEVDAVRGAVQGLPDPDRCVRAAASPSPPARLPAAALAFEQRLAQIRVELRVGRSFDARAHAAAMIAEAEQLGQPTLRLHAHLVHASINGALLPRTTIDELRLTSRLAIELHDDAALADSLIVLTDALARIGRHDQAELTLDLANALVARLGGDPARAATGALGLCLFGWQRGPDFTRARAACDDARAKVLADGGDPDDIRLTWIDTELANIDVADGKLDDAIATYRRNIAYRAARAFRPDQIAEVADRNNWGIALFQGERYREAIEVLTTVVTLDPAKVSAWDHLGFAYRALGERGPAFAAAVRSYEITERGEDPAAPCDRAFEVAVAGVAAGERAATRAILDRAAPRCPHDDRITEWRTRLGPRP